MADFKSRVLKLNADELKAAAGGWNLDMLTPEQRARFEELNKALWVDPWGSPAQQAAQARFAEYCSELDKQYGWGELDNLA